MPRISAQFATLILHFDRHMGINPATGLPVTILRIDEDILDIKTTSLKIVRTIFCLLFECHHVDRYVNNPSTASVLFQKLMDDQ